MSTSPRHLGCSLLTRVRVEGSGLGAEGQALQRLASPNSEVVEVGCGEEGPDDPPELDSGPRVQRYPHVWEQPLVSVERARDGVRVDQTGHAALQRDVGMELGDAWAWQPDVVVRCPANRDHAGEAICPWALADWSHSQFGTRRGHDVHGSRDLVALCSLRHLQHQEVLRLVLEEEGAPRRLSCGNDRYQRLGQGGCCHGERIVEPGRGFTLPRNLWHPDRQGLLRPLPTHSNHWRVLERTTCGGLARTVSWNRNGPARCLQHRTGPNPTEPYGGSAWLSGTLPQDPRLDLRHRRAASAGSSTPLINWPSCSLSFAELDYG